MSSCGDAGVYGVIPAAADVCPHPAETSGVTSELVAGAAPAVCTSEQPGSLSLTRTRSPRPITLRETGRPTGMPVPEGGLIRCCLPASKRSASLSVYKHVDDLCAMMLNLCVHSGRLGIPLPSRNRNRASAWESTNHVLWIQRKFELSTCRVAKMTNARIFILALSSCNLMLGT